jgi:nucleotide-binding universal stress UspA family protein
MIGIKRILAPTDLSEASLPGIKYAVSLAQEYGAEVIIIHVVDGKDIPRSTAVPAEAMVFFRIERVPTANVPQHFVDTEMRKREQELYHFLFWHIEPEVLRSVKITRLIRIGRIVDEIVGAAGSEESDLIVMSSRGWGWLRKLLFGSLSEKVARKAPCPVLTIQPWAVVREDGRRMTVKSLVLEEAEI